jgi:hypothetical protein
MKIITQLRFYFVLVTLAFIALLVNHVRVKDELDKYKTDAFYLPGGDIAKAQQIDSLERRCDSLYNELFPAQVELGRYEVAYSIFLERNPKAAKEYGTIISEETE